MRCRVGISDVKTACRCPDSIPSLKNYLAGRLKDKTRGASLFSAYTRENVIVLGITSKLNINCLETKKYVCAIIHNYVDTAVSHGNSRRQYHQKGPYFPSCSRWHNLSDLVADSWSRAGYASDVAGPLEVVAYEASGPREVLVVRKVVVDEYGRFCRSGVSLTDEADTYEQLAAFRRAVG